ncbi:unnamed protein product [Arctogadus glacialis]
MGEVVELWELLGEVVELLGEVVELWELLGENGAGRCRWTWEEPAVVWRSAVTVPDCDGSRTVTGPGLRRPRTATAPDCDGPGLRRPRTATAPDCDGPGLRRPRTATVPDCDGPGL